MDKPGNNICDNDLWMNRNDESTQMIIHEMDKLGDIV